MPGQRPDAQRNHDRILEVARVVIREQGAQASLRDVARRAGVGLGTLYRHFPTRDALLESLMRRRFEHLRTRAETLAAEAEAGAGAALGTWLVEFAYVAGAYRGLPSSIMATLADQTSPLHQACDGLRQVAGRLLAAAQAAGDIRPDLTAGELFALVNAVGWITERSPGEDRHPERLLTLITGGLARRPR
jgi:AcrR family transcriptional regulator